MLTKTLKQINTNETTMPEGTINYLSLDEFRKADIRIGKITGVKDHPKADKLYVFKVDLAESSPRTIVAGLRPFYKKEALLHKKAIFVANLAPAVLRGVESNGMLLAAVDDTEGKVVLLTTEKEIKEGANVQ